MLLEINDGTVTRCGRRVLDRFSFFLKENEKIAIVGRNGAGKTTLLQVLAGERSLDRDEKHPSSGIKVVRDFTTAVLTQRAVKNPEETVEELVLRSFSGKQTALRNFSGSFPAQLSAEDSYEKIYSRERYDFEQRFSRIFTELGFSLEDRGKKLSEFSGGEQTKIMLIDLLLSEPDVLILDEPTNHLDAETMDWLEVHLKEYPGAVVMVSHDRFLIDRSADTVWEITAGKLIRYPGNYTSYRKSKAQRYQRQMKEYEAQQKEISRLNGLIERFRHKPRKAAFIRSRRTILGRMQQIPKPDPDDAVIHTGDILPAVPGNKNVLDCERLQIGYDKPFREITFRLRRGQKVGIFGPNGTGKSTFLKTIAGRIPPLDGKLRIGEHTEIGYFDQMSSDISSERNVFDWFHSLFPVLTGEEVRRILSGYLFRKQDFGKKVDMLSGGEKARLVLASILQRRPNFLILDEPTNNMDIPAKETLESIFRDYRGTILFVSHDRYFLSRVAESLLFFPQDSSEVRYYPFDYLHYEEKRRKNMGNRSFPGGQATEEPDLADDLRAVPKPEHFRLREMSTEDAYFDWQYSLNRPERERAEEIFRKASEEASGYPQTEEICRDAGAWEEICRQRIRARESARDAWTARLLDWYDIWIEQHEPATPED